MTVTTSETQIALLNRYSEKLRRDQRQRLIGLIVMRLALAVFLLGLWEYVSGPRLDPGTIIDEFYVSRPSQILDALLRWIDQGVLFPSVFQTIINTVIGFAIGATLGLIFGFLIASNPFVAEVVDPFITAVYSIPRLALVPLFMLWFGIGMSMKLALVASVVFFLVFYATYAGVKEVDETMKDKLRLMRASWLGIALKVTLPSAATFIISGLRISAPYALVAEVTAEMMSSNAGLGYLLIRSSSQYYTPGVFAAILLMMLIGMWLTWFVGLIERRALRWKPRRRAS